MDNYLNASSIITKELPKKIISWITILIISLIAFIIVGIYYEYPQYLNYRGNIIKEKKEYFIKVLVLEDDLLKIKKGKLILNKKNMDFNIKYIEPVYYLDSNEQKYYEVVLNSKLQEDLKVENNPILIKFELPKTTLIKEVIKKIRKGMM